MFCSTRWARSAALIASVALTLVVMPGGGVLAQQESSQALEQASSGNDGNSGAGANSGNTSSGNAGRDGNGNGGSASAGDAGATEDTGSTGAPLPENAELLEALGILDDVTNYGLTVLSGLDIPIELLPPPVAEPISAVPEDVNTGGQGGSGESSSISTEPGSGEAPAGGSINSASEDGVGSTSTGERKRDRQGNTADGGSETTTSGG
ncbi:MAG: hypothetical protein M3Q50_11640 [Chloroflexota bacterium]|nr:hypothetical protein [Chloroflexota bacterium]